MFDSTKVSIFDGTTSAFANTGSGATLKQTKLERMGNYCEDAYDWMKQYKADCADFQSDGTTANPKKDTWECKKAFAMRKALNSYRFYHGLWAAGTAANPGTYRWFNLDATA